MQAPEAIDAEGRTIRDEHNTQNILTGVAASSGRVRGRARLVQTVEEAMKLQPGDILVTMATDPGWTPVFPLASGLILEIGGQLSHGAIIAREFGLPAVINIPSAMRLIQDGQMLEIDGTNGLVYLE